MKAFLFYLVQFTWGLPVNLISGMIFLVLEAKGCDHSRFFHAFITYIPCASLRGGMSLGIFIFVAVKRGEPIEKCWNRDSSIHEYGHTYQALLLGPLYWLVIGLPSIIWRYFFDAYRKKNDVSYYKLYCESWANRWGRKFTKERFSNAGMN